MSELVLVRNKSRVYRELSSVVAIVAREITLLVKSPSTIIMSLYDNDNGNGYTRG